MAEFGSFFIEAGQFLAQFGHVIFYFLIVLSVLVFVHELGHYLAARLCGVRVEEFSIGFGPELFGLTDRRGTRWKVSLIPLGGYVKMHGNELVALESIEGLDKKAQLARAKSSESFQHKTVGQRSFIVAAGPLINFAFALFLFFVLFFFNGHPNPPPVVKEVFEDTPAHFAGLQADDMITAVDGEETYSFGQVAQGILSAEGEEVLLTIKRQGEYIDFTIQPELIEEEGQEYFRIGISGLETLPLSMTESFILSLTEMIRFTNLIVTGVGEIITGQRSTEELGGPIRIAQVSSFAAEQGVNFYIFWMALLSLNLGLVNLFPIPMLDGGHLFFYLLETLRQKPLSRRTQEIGFKIGLILLMGLLFFTTWNDIIHWGQI